MGNDDTPTTSDEDPDLTLPEEPEPAYVRDSHSTIHPTSSNEAEESDSIELEATELRALNAATADLPPISHVLTPRKPLIHWHDHLRRFWRHEVRISVPHDDCRDHLANERTFLGYLRSSLAFSMLGTLVAQFYQLEQSTDPSKVFGYSILGKPLSVIFQSSALVIVLLGGVRYLRQQSSMARGKVHAGGWEVTTIAVLSLLLLLMMLGVHLALIFYQD